MCTHLLVLRISRALEARESPNLFFACVWTRTRMCACGVSVECIGCVRQVVPDKKKDTYFN